MMLTLVLVGGAAALLVLVGVGCALCVAAAQAERAADEEARRRQAIAQRAGR